MSKASTFNILDHRDKLIIIKETASELICECPGCGGHSLKIAKSGTKAGAYKCWSNECKEKDIRDAIAPLPSRQARQIPKKPVVKKPQAKPAAIPTGLRLAQLPAPATDSPQPQLDFDRQLGEILKTTYVYSLTPVGQLSRWVVRTDWVDPSKPKGRDKKFCQWHQGAFGQPVPKKGDQPWDAYRIDEAIAAVQREAAPGLAVALILGEGEKVVEALRKIGLVTITLQGSSWGEADLKRLTDTLNARCPGVTVVMVRDNDAAGEKKAAKVQAACNSAVIPCLIIDPLAILPDLPEGEGRDVADILEMMDTPEFIRRLEEEIHRAAEQSRQESLPPVDVPDDANEREAQHWLDPDYVGNGTVEGLILDTLFESGEGQRVTIEDTFYRDTGKGYWSRVPDKSVLKTIGLKCKKAYKLNKYGERVFPFFTDSKKKSAFQVCRDAIDVGELPANRHLRCFNNCTVDLRTGEPIPHDPKHFLTTTVAADYQPNQPCPQVFLDFIRSAYGEDLIEVIRAYTSMLLAPTAPYGKFIHLMGPSGSGKGTLLRLWGEMFAVEHFRSGEFNNLSTAEGRHQYLTSAALYTVPDVGGYIQGLKAFYELVDNGPMTGRALFSSNAYQKRWDTRFVIASVDHLQIENSGDGWERRCLPLPTKAREGIEDPNLGTKLASVKGQIISWALAMPREERDRLILHPSTNERVLALKQDAAIHGDPVRAFVDLCLRPAGNAHSYLESHQLHSWFGAFCQQHGYQGWGMSKFVNHLKTILPNHYVPRRRASATEDINRGMIPAHWSGIIDLAGVFIDLTKQESSSDNGTEGTQLSEPQWTCFKSMCREGGLMAFKEPTKSPPPDGSPGSLGSPTTQKVTDPRERTQKQAFWENGSVGSPGSQGGYQPESAADENQVKHSDKSFRRIELTSPTPLSDPTDPTDPSPETLDLAFAETDQAQKSVADPSLVADPDDLTNPWAETARNEVTDWNELLIDELAKLDNSSQSQQPVTPATGSTIPSPRTLAAQILLCQSWVFAMEAMDTVSKAIKKDRANVFRLVLKHINLDDRQHLVRLLAAHIQQFPHDRWAYSWLPESSRKLREKAQALAQEPEADG